ncbi:MAG: T9SS type A sorting domain-containing protein [Bacteroidales bacterium]
MKHFAALLLFLFFMQGHSQITITQNDLPTVNDTIYYKIGLINNFDPNYTGSNITWDFSQISLNNQRADTIVPVTSTPVVYNIVFNFTIANLAFINQTPPNLGVGLTVSDYYDFYKKSSTYYRKAGFGATINGIQTPVKYDNPELYFKLPLTYGTSDSSVSSYGFSIPSYGYFGQTISRKHIADGWGTLITPFGNYNAIRVKETVNITDTIFNETMNYGFLIHRPTSYEYYWLANGLKSYAAKITQNGPSNIIEVRYEPQLNVNSQLHSEILVSPNPIVNELFVENLPQGIKNIKIINLQGAVVYEENFNQNYKQIQVNNLQNGIYILKIQLHDSIISKKILIQH